jgi:hypothetical protein
VIATHDFMWIPRTPEEAKKWHATTVREARTAGLFIAGLVWLGLTVLLAGGWIAGGRAGVIAQVSVSEGSFWGRLPIFALAGLPVAFYLFRREQSKELEHSTNMTICPKCDTAGEGNAETPCNCGGTFVLQSTVRWLDDESSK